MDREFLRPATGRDLDSDIDRGMIIRALSGKDQSEPLSDKHLLSRLAGLQNACGSWGEDEQQVELTAAALLAFVRRGHTLSRGGYRRIVIKAVKWLLANFATDDVSRQARALALIELQQVCTDALLAGVGTAEQEAVKGIAIPAMKTARTLEHVRDAAMSRIKVRVEYQPSIGEAGWIWLAALDQ
jgi:hypothetical protein